MKRLSVAMLMASILVISALPNANAAVTPGTKCAKAGIKQDYKGNTYTCVKSEGRLVWDKGINVDKYDAAFAAVFLAEAQDEAERILADAKLKASQISRPPNCAVGNSQAFVSIGGDPSTGVIALIYENPGNCDLVVRASAEFYCPRGRGGNNTVISRGTFALKAQTKIFVSLNPQRYFPLVTLECAQLTGYTSNTISVANELTRRTEPRVTVESSVFSGVFNQAVATKKANEIVKIAQSRAKKIISDAKNPVMITKAWIAQRLPGSGNLCILNTNCPIGSTGPGGGIVFYDAGSQKSWGRYLEVAPADWSGFPEDPQMEWCGYMEEFRIHTYKVIKEIESMALRVATLKEVIGNEIGKGRANTDVLLALCSEGAAPTVNMYKGGGKSDWFLPSRDELNELCKHALSSPIGKSDAICQYQKYRKGFADWNYWSSSIAPDGLCEPWGSPVWIQTFWNGEQACGSNGSFNVRPIRAFPVTKSAAEKIIDWKPVRAALEKAAAEKAALDKAALEKAAAEKAAAEKSPAERAAADAKAASFVCIPGSNCPIGSTGPGGGIVFYDAGSQQSWGRYLEFAPDGWSGPANSADPRLDWCNIHDVDFSKSISDVTLTASIGVEIGKGKANTNLMVARCSSGAGYAAQAYKGGNKNDWYLPSRDELNELCKFAKYQATGKVDVPCQRGISLRAGFVVQIRYYDPGKNWYWSSSESGALFASIKDFSIDDEGGRDYSGRKGEYAKSVRPIRAF